jgi:lipopolysaccharide transport system permease protein
LYPWEKNVKRLLNFSKALINIAAPFKLISENRELLRQLVKRNIYGRYRGTAGGLAWSVMQPLLMLAVYTFIFSVVFKSRWGTLPSGGIDGSYSYSVIMFCGMTVFSVFSESITAAPMLIVSNPNYVKKIIFPIEILPIAQVISSTIINLIWMAILFIGAVFLLKSLYWTMLLLPIIFIPFLFFTTGLSFFVASLGVYFRDLAHVNGIIVQILFLLTPIFYSTQMVPEKFQFFLKLNPLTWIVEETRAVFLFKQLPNWDAIIVIIIISFLTFQLGYVWLNKTKKGFADVL